MKKIFIIQTLLLLIFLAGCSDSNYKDFADSQLKIESSDINFSAMGGTGEIVVAENETFTATSDKDWCNLSISGKVISVTATPNMSISGRTARITVKSNNKINYVSVTQTSISLSIETDNISISGRGDEARITYSTEAEMTIGNIADSWLTASVDGNEIVFEATPNPSLTSTRSTTVILAVQSQGNTLLVYNISVTQGANYLTYEDYLGIYTMNYSITYASSIPTRSLTVTLSVKSEGQTYRLDGILADGSPGEITVNYNNADGSISLLGQVMHVYPDTQYDFWWLPYSTDAYISRTATYGMFSTDFDLSNGGLKFRMVDNGLWTRITAGFMLRNYNGSTSMGNINGKDGQPYYFYPSFEKQ
jgi:hypothetical protein